MPSNVNLSPIPVFAQKRAVKHPDKPFIIPATPLPSFDYNLYIQSLRKIGRHRKDLQEIEDLREMGFNDINVKMLQSYPAENKS